MRNNAGNKKTQRLVPGKPELRHLICEATYQMDEPGCGEPRADKDGEQIHQLDGITVRRQQAKPRVTTQVPAGAASSANRKLTPGSQCSPHSQGNVSEVA